MGEANKVLGQKLKHTGIFSFSDLYSFCFEWFEENKFVVEEEEYSEKKSGDSRDINIDWKAWKEVTDYFKFTIKIHFRILGLKDIEVMENGKKKKANQGFVEMKFTAILEKDYEGRWEKTAFQKFFRETYDKFLVRDRIEQMEEKLFNETTELIEQMKAYFSILGRR